MKRLFVALAVVAGALVAAPRTSDAATPSPSHGLTTTKQEQLNKRITEFTFTTKAVQWPTFVRVMLPENYDPSGKTRYPVLYLLHGGGGNQTDWTVQGDAEAATKNYPYIVVMGECHQFGNYSDWWNFGRPGAPQWETYFIDQLVPWIDAHYSTAGDRFHRAIAGLSMGGGGAMGLAAHNPDLFGAAAAFSGAVDTNQLPVQALVEASSLQAGLLPGAIFGQRATDEVRWRGSNPWDLASNLQHMQLYLTTGNGYPGGEGRDTGDPVEGAVYQMMRGFHNRLTTLGYPHGWKTWVKGGHNWWYWKRSLREFLPQLKTLWQGDAPNTTSFDFRTIDAKYSVYGWTVSIERKALEFSQLHVRADGFSLTGSGRAVVTTPTGRRVSVDLGPANPFQQYTAQGNAWVASTTRGGHAWPSKTVDVSLR